MKIKPEHYQILKEKLSSLLPQLAADHYRRLKLDPKVKDINERFRWDCLWAAKVPHETMSEIYKYANDEHIDTVLKKIIKELGFVAS